MFTRAGFNARHRLIALAAWGAGGLELIRFVPSGDLAWHRRAVYLGWKPLRGVRNLIDCGLTYYERLTLPQSELPQ
jgi:hypothetical protein